MVAALVVDDLGCRIPLHDIDITFENRFVPGSGGHANITTEAPITGHYQAIEAYGGDIPETQERSISFPQGAPQSYTVAPVVEGKTNQLGWFAANYIAGIFGGEERLKVTASIEHISEKDPAFETSKEDTLTIGVAGLVEMERDGLNHKFSFGISCGKFNPDARWLIAANKERALKLAQIWSRRYGDVLVFNDASLINGGIIEKKNFDNACHRSHRNGIDIDVNRKLNKLDDDCRIESGKRVCRLDDIESIISLVGFRWIRSSGIHFRGE